MQTFEGKQFHLGTYAGCTDNGIETVRFLSNCDLLFREELLKFCLVLGWVAHSVKIYLRVEEGVCVSKCQRCYINMHTCINMQE